MNQPSAPGRPRRRAAPVGLLGALALIAATERTAASHRLSLVGPGAASYGYAARASRAAGGNDCLCPGDSLMKFGAAPRVIEARSGYRAINLASFAGAAPMTYYVFRRALDAGARPKAVFVDFKATLLQTSPAGQHAHFAEALDLSEAFDLARSLRDPVFFARVAALRWLPSLRTRQEIREWVSESLAGGPAPTAPPCSRWSTTGTATGGAASCRRTPTRRPPTGAGTRRTSSPPAPGRATPVNARYVKRFLDLAARRSIPVYWLVLPIHLVMQARRDGAAADAGFEGLLRSAVRRYPGLTVVDGRHSGYPARVFVDGSHLDAFGANALSVEMAALLSGDRPGPGDAPRWRDLPAFRPRAVDPGLEDLDGSWAAVTGRVDLAERHHPLRFRR